MSTRCPRSRWRSLGVHAQAAAKSLRDRRRFRRCLPWPPGPVVDDAPTCASGSRLVPAGEARLLHPCCTNDAIAQRVHEPRGSGGAVHLRCARSERLHGKRRSAGRDQQRAARRAPQELPLTTLRAQGQEQHGNAEHGTRNTGRGCAVHVTSTAQKVPRARHMHGPPKPLSHAPATSASQTGPLARPWRAPPTPGSAPRRRAPTPPPLLPAPAPPAAAAPRRRNAPAGGGGEQMPSPP